MSEEQQEGRQVSAHLMLATDVISAYVSNNHVGASEFASLIETIHQKLLAADGLKVSAVEVAAAVAQPAAQQAAQPPQPAAAEEVAPERTIDAAAASSSSAGASAGAADASREPELFESQGGKNSSDAAPERTPAAAKSSGSRTARPKAAAAEKPVPFGNIQIGKSVTPDAIICLEDGKPFKSLKRHLRHKYNMTPEEYRRKWNLADDYPMVAPNYTAERRRLAEQMGLGKRVSGGGKSTEAAQANA